MEKLNLALQEYRGVLRHRTSPHLQIATRIMRELRTKLNVYAHVQNFLAILMMFSLFSVTHKFVIH